MIARPKVALIGAGAMGGALLRGWLAASAIDAGRSAIFDPSAGEGVAALARAAGLSVNPPAEPRYDAIVLAVKPQALADAAPYAPMAAGALVVSVLAGRSIASVSSVLGTPRVVRAMPNLPSMVGAGAAGVFAPAAAGEADRAVARALMAAVGAVVFVDSEAALDAVTAISGSGPAYFFLLAEALEEAGLDLGLSPETAAALARQTLIGAGAVAAVDERDVSDLRLAVTSPGGTTEAALKALDGEGGAIRTLMKKAAAAAFRRAGELTS